jgi:polyisoprenyl-phosphate glycosyltransferase
MKKKTTFTVVIPVFNNAKSLPNLLEAMDTLRAELAARSLKLQVLLVDDGSSDNSFAILARRHLERGDIEVVKLTRNFGAIGALKIVLEYVKGDAFLFLAADLQDPPDLIPALVDHWLTGSRYVVAVRRQREDTVFANVFARIFYWLLSKSVVSNYPKNGFDLALMDRQFIPYIRQTGKHVNFPLFPFWLGYEPVYVEYDRQAVPGKKSSWTFFKKLNLAVDSLLSFSRTPTRFLSLAGIGLSVLSFGYAAFIIGAALFGKVEVPGFATIIVLMSVLNGVSMLFMGVICEYLWRIFDEVNGHPAAVVDLVLTQTTHNAPQTADTRADKT